LLHAVISTVAGRRGILDASIVSAAGLFMLGVGVALSAAGAEATLSSVARCLTLGGLTLFGFGWLLCACFGRPKWLRPWFARGEPAPWRGARPEALVSDQEAWLESGSRVAEQERRVRERVQRPQSPAL